MVGRRSHARGVSLRSALLVGGLWATSHVALAQGTGTGTDTVTQRAAPLAPVVTKAEAAAARLDQLGFTRRRLTSGAPPSQFLTRADIERRAVLNLSELLRRMRGRSWGCTEGVLYIDGALTAAPVGFLDPAPDTVRMGATDGRRTNIPATLVRPPPRQNALDQIPVNAVEAMEVYAGPSEIPLEFKAAFRQARCVVVVWTR